MADLPSNQGLESLLLAQRLKAGSGGDNDGGGGGGGGQGGIPGPLSALNFGVNSDVIAALTALMSGNKSHALDSLLKTAIFPDFFGANALLNTADIGSLTTTQSMDLTKLKLFSSRGGGKGA